MSFEPVARRAIEGASSVQELLRVVKGGRWAVARLGTVMGYVAGWSFILCAVFITFDVLARAFLGFSSKATTEITGYTLAFGIAWALAHTLTMRAHVRIDALINLFPLAVRGWLHVASLAALGVFAGFLIKGAYDLVDESLLFRATDITALQTPLALPQGLWAFGIAVFFFLIVLMLVENLMLLAMGRADEVEANLHSRGYDEEAAEALEATAQSTTRAAIQEVAS
jgi:TRAP-type C4-dicarboxylate transport system permease small subunit